MADPQHKESELIEIGIPPDDIRGRTHSAKGSRGKDVPDTDIWHGLTNTEAQLKLETDGYNELAKDEDIPLWKLFVMQFTSFIILLLLAAAIASFALGEHIEGIAVLVIVLLNASITVYTEKSASNALAALASMSEPLTTVVRHGESKPIPTREVVVGDVILIEAGDIISADAHLVDSADLKVNEMPLTGESADVTKNHGIAATDKKTLTPPNRVFSGTTVAAGTGTGIVIATGMNTRVGKIALLLLDSSTEKPNCIGVKPPKQTPLQQKLHKLGLIISFWALLACITVFFIGGFARNYKDPQHPDNSPLVQMALVAVSLAVSAIPESLPLCVTICLALGTKDMANKCNSLVRRLPAVETLGSAQVICSDKTGTLTEGKMTALKVWCLGGVASDQDREIDVTGQGLVPVGEFLENGKQIHSPSDNDVQLASCLTAAALNCTAELRLAEDRDTLRQVRAEETRHGFSSLALGHKWVAQGNTSEVPLVVVAAKAGIFPLHFENTHPSVGRRAIGKLGAEVPFSSERKIMISVVHTDDGRFGNLQLPRDDKYVVLVKGAPNYILNQCKSGLFQDRMFGTFDEAAKKRVLRAVDDLSAQALRVLAVAIRPLRELPYNPADALVEAQQKYEMLNDDLTFVGLIASIDPEREGVRDAINVARGAGVRTVMITGDYLKTAVAIAKNIDLINFDNDPDEVSVDCTTLRPLGNQYLPPYEIDEITSRCVVFARAQPEDKLQIVQSLQRQGLVTSMTGDGVNDAPALNEADIGVAMGINGTEVAKGASDMILLDDNFVTIVNAIRKGRQIYGNIQKFVIYFVGTNAAQVLIILFSVIVGIPIPFGPLVILFLNLAIDGTTSMSISLQPEDANVMKIRPRPRTQPLITSKMWFIALAHAVALFSMVFITYGLGLYWETGYITMDKLMPGGDTREDCKVYQDDGSWEHVHDKDCVPDAMLRARTMAFITIMYSEVLRGMSVKSDLPFYCDMLANKWLVGAMTLSSALGTMLMFIPGVNDIFGLAGDKLEYWQWFTCLTAVLFILVVDEYVKARFRRQNEIAAERDEMRDFFNSVLSEMRQLRHHLNDLETKLQLREDRPIRRAEIQESAKALAHALGEMSKSQRPTAIQEWSQVSYRSHSLFPTDDHDDSASRLSK